MEFWAIADNHNEDFFYNFKENTEVSGLSASCFLPSEEMANQFIEDELSVNYTAVPVTLTVLEANGSFSYELGKIRECQR